MSTVACVVCSFSRSPNCPVSVLDNEYQIVKSPEFDGTTEDNTWSFLSLLYHITGMQVNIGYENLFYWYNK